MPATSAASRDHLVAGQWAFDVDVRCAVVAGSLIVLHEPYPSTLHEASESGMLSAMASHELRQQLLNDGLEGLTQLPHVIYAAEGSAERDEEVVRVRTALRELLEEGEIVVFRSHWKELDSPIRLSTEDAANLLSDPYWFSFHLNEEPEDRLQFINVKNLVGDPPKPGDRLG